MAKRDFSITVDIAAVSEHVWRVMSDIERWAEWTRSIKSIRLLDKGPLAIGSKALVRQPKLLPAVWKVTALDPSRSFTWKSGFPGVSVEGRHSVESVGPGRCRARLSLRFDGLFGGLVAQLTRGLNNRYLNLEAEGLKRRSESVAAAPAAK